MEQNLQLKLLRLKKLFKKKVYFVFQLYLLLMKKNCKFYEKKFKRLKIIGLNEWPLPKEMINKISLLEKLKKVI